MSTSDALDGASRTSSTVRLVEQTVEGDRRQIERRYRVLANAGFVDVYFRDVGSDDQYEVTSWGELYLDGDVDTELQRPLPAVRPPDKVRPVWWAGFG
jgi:hypothetical protein